MSERPETVEEFNAKFLRECILAVAHDLRQLAEEVERETIGVDRIGSPGRSSYGQVAGDVHHALAWGWANLKVDRLIRYAADADAARAKGE